MTDSVANDLDEALAAEEARWTRHVQLLDWQPGYRIRGPEDPFTPAQEYLHHAHWLEYASSHARARLDGGDAPATIEDVDAQNDAWATEDAGMPHESAKARAEAARAEYIEVISQSGRTDARVIASVTGNLVDHFDTHFGYMVDGMLEHESVQWERMTAALDSHPRGRLHRGEDGISWEATTVYAHLERWMDVQARRVHAFLEHGEVPALEATVDELNGRWMPEDASLRFETARRHAYLTRDRFVRMVREVPIGAWNARLVGLCAGNSVGHYQEHLAWIVREYRPGRLNFGRG